MGSISPPEEDQDLSFANLPPFPSDVPTVPLLRISLKNLLGGDAAEEDKLWRACCDLGFFYFDLRDGNGTTGEGEAVHGDDLLKAADEMFELAEGVFELDGEEKERYSMVSLSERRMSLAHTVANVVFYLSGIDGAKLLLRL